MSHFDIDGIDRELLKRYIAISFPECQFSLHETSVVFSGENLPDDGLIAELLHTLRMASDGTGGVPKSSPRHARKFPEIEEVLVQNRNLRWIGDGMAVLSGDFLTVKRGLERHWQKIATERFCAIEIENPAIWSPRVARESRYLEDFPQEASLIFGAKRTRESIERLQSVMASSSGVTSSNLITLLDLDLLGYCQPSVCTSCYYALSMDTDTENATYSTYNRVFRNEGTNSLTRLMSFSVRDIMAVGSPDFVRSMRDEFLVVAQNFFNDFGLIATLETASDPFFANRSKKILYQAAAGLKHEMLADIPHLEKPLAVGSINLHLDTFGERFGLQLSGRAVHSACMGVGFERLTFAIFSQNGPFLSEWSAELLDRLGIAKCGS